VAVGRVGGVAVLLLLGDERPLLIELDLTGPRGKKPRAPRERRGRAVRRLGRAGRRGRGGPRRAARWGGWRTPRRGARGLPGPSPRAGGSGRAGALALGGAGAAGVAVELAEPLVLAEATADREGAGVAPAAERAVRVLAAAMCEVVHEADRAGE